LATDPAPAARYSFGSKTQKPRLGSLRVVGFVDHDEGVTVRLGRDSYVRDAEGNCWREKDPEPGEPA
jgi:hypothetical protein